MAAPGQQSLRNFYQSVMYSHPTVATLMQLDILTVAMYGLSKDKSEMAQEAADRLRVTARPLPEVLVRVLESSLIELGYS